MRFVYNFVFIVSCSVFLLSCGPEEGRIQFADLKPFWWNAPPILLSQDPELRPENMDRVQFQTGKEAKNQVVAGNVDVGVVAATPIVLAAMAKEDFIVLGQYLTGSGLVAIITPIQESKLAEPIAVVKGTVSEFVFVEKAGLDGKDPEKLQVLSLAPPSVLQALQSGSAKSAIIWDPFAQAIEEALPEITVVRNPDLYQMRFYLIASRRSWNNRNELIRNFIKQLKLAVQKVSTPEGQSLVDQYVKSQGQLPGVWDADRVRFEYIDGTTEAGQEEIISNLQSEAKILAKANLLKSSPDFKKFLPSLQ